MKKVFAILFVAGMASLAACTSKTEGSADSTTVDTTATSVMAPADTTVTTDTTAVADTTKK
ncbi:hypothetical protein D0T08_05185 [Emticicia sp. C21]|nr:hypothetical protein D0T08_05185 [Emticicia sp. C21]